MLQKTHIISTTKSIHALAYEKSIDKFWDVVTGENLMNMNGTGKIHYK